MTPRWQWVLATPDGAPLGELTAATSRKLSMVLNDSHSANVSIDGRHPQAAAISELATDLLVYRDGELLMRGRCGTSGDDLDEDSHNSDISAVSYRGVLHRRIPTAPKTYTGVDQTDIAWDLVQLAQSSIVPNSDLGITRGGGHPSGTVRDYSVEAGTAIDEAIENLGHVFGGFEWDVLPDMVFECWPDTRGTTKDLPLIYGTTATKVRRQLDTGDYANVVRVSGQAENQDDPAPSAVKIAPDLADRPEGRWDAQIGATDLKTQALVADRAELELALLGNPIPAYTFTLRPGVWSPADLWLGDTTTYRVRSGRLDASGIDRVRQIDITLDGDGGETVEITVGKRRQNWVRFFRVMPRRLERLERR